MHELSARVAEANAKITREEIAQLTKDADEMEARIKQVAEMEERGYWECANGHEELLAKPDEHQPVNHCMKCGSTEVKWLKRDLMTGQEKYASDKDRADAEKLVAARREAIAGKQKDLENQEATAKYFRGQSNSSRQLAEALRNV